MSENKHTPEPWSAGVIKYKGEWHFTAVPVGNEGKITALCGLAGANGEDESIANARRIVACVNACAGIPTYQLTAENDNPTNLGEVIDAIRDQRDELLAALERCRFALEPYDDIKPRDWKSDRLNLRDAHQVAVAAIAGVKGEQ